MASGGTWQTQNKVRPGAYINVNGVAKPLSQVGNRGVVAVAMPLSWGEKVIELTASEFLSGAGLLKAGVLYSDSNGASTSASPGFNLRLILQNASKVIIYRTNESNASESGYEIDEFVYITSKLKGTFGNRISVKFEHEASGKYVLKTYIDSKLSGTTKADALTDLTGDALVDLDWYDQVEWDSDLENVVNLQGGTDGATLDTNWLSDAIREFNSRAWDVFVCECSSATEKSQVKSAIEDLRENNGVKVQCVLYNDATADYEGVINIAENTSYIISDGTVVRPEQVAFYVAGITAGASITQSNTGAVVTDAIDLVNNSQPKTNDEIIEALSSGHYVLSRRSDGAIVVEKDINSLHSFTPTKGYVFSKNRPIRTIDEICNSIKLLYNKSYLGKVDNSESGRSVLKGDIASYLRSLETIGAIQNFDPDTDITISAGDDIDGVLIDIYAQPLDSMEKLYAQINVEG